MSQAFLRYCGLFHQDIFEIHGTLEDAIADNISALTSDERKELEVDLQKLLNRGDNLVNMDIGDFGFSTVKGLRYFLEQSLTTVQDQIQ
ncbi:hypothetical protein [Asticcacaulis sp.]|uniref:hypothetical protein n=1 Tax=Asticcacaulis sp. TaxID=1872648 RepID=UPI003F7BA6D6